MLRTLLAILVASFPIAFIHSTKVNGANNKLEKTLISPTHTSTIIYNPCQSKFATRESEFWDFRSRP